MAQTVLNSGVKITVDTSDIDVKFTRSVEQLNASLTRTQKSLHLTYNENGHLIDSLGRCVEGLTTAQIKLGMWVDEEAKARTFTGQFADGLSRTELELGWYSDALGNVYKRTGEMARAAKTCADEQQKVTSIFNSTREAASDAADGIDNAAQAVNDLAEHYKNIGIISEEFANGIQESMNGLQAYAGIVKASFDFSASIKGSAGQLQEIKKAFSSFTEKAAKSSSVVMKSVGGIASSFAGVAPIVAGAAVGVGALFYRYMDAIDVNKRLSDSYKELEKKAKAAGVTIKEVGDVLKVGAFKTPANELKQAAQELQQAQKDLEKIKDDVKKAEAAQLEVLKTGGMSGANTFSKPFSELQKQTEAEANYKNLMADFNALVEQRIEAAREEQKTDVERLEEKKKEYELIKEYAKGTEANAIIDKQIEIINNKIKEAKEKGANEAADAAEKARQDRLKAAGISTYLEKSKNATAEILPTLEAFKDTVTQWKASVENGDITQEELNNAVKAYAQEIRARLGQNLGVDFSETQDNAGDQFQTLKEALDNNAISQEDYTNGLKQLQAKNAEILAGKIEELDASKKWDDLRDQYEEQIRKLNEELENNRIDEQQHRAAINAAQGQYAAVLREKAEAELGIDFEQAPAPSNGIEDYKNNVARLSELLEAGAITQEQYNAAQEQLKQAMLEN